MGDIYCGALVSSDYLEHHGIKGMRWGVRRFQREDGSLTSAGKKQKLKNERKNEETRKAVKENRHDRAARASQRDADDLRRHGYIKEADAVQKVADKQREKAEQVRIDKMRKDVKNRRTLSDKDLDAKIERLKKESELKRLTNESLRPGRTEVANVLKNSGKNILGKVATGVGLYAVKYALTKKFDASDFAGYVAPKPKNK